MRDLTQGSITRHLMSMAAFIAVSMLFQTLYYLADLYFVGKLGPDAVAAVSLAGTIAFLVIGVTQMLSVGTTTLIAHAAGRKDQPRANQVFNQSFVLSVLVGFVLMGSLFLLRYAYCRSLGANGDTALLGEQYLRLFIPAMFLQFGMLSMGAGLRGTGIVKPTMLLTVGTLVVNIVLAPILTLGWLTHRPFGVMGAAMATLIAMAVGLVGFWAFFLYKEKYLRFDAATWAPDWKTYREVLTIGTPAGAELALMSVYLTVVYAIIRPFGAAAQAGFGIGARVMQAMFLPVLAVCFSIPPVAGQNFGARKVDRVRATFKDAAIIAAIYMLAVTVVAHIAPAAMVRFFSKDLGVIAFGTEYLRIISYNFVSAGLVFSMSSMFQAMGNTVPSLISSAMRLITFALPAWFLSLQPGFVIRQVWYVSVASIFLQMTFSYWLLRREMRKRLPAGSAEQVAVGA